MRISVSRWKLFWECPEKYRQHYLDERVLPPGEGQLFGSKGHLLLEEHLKEVVIPKAHIELPTVELEGEVLELFAQYKAHWGEEDWEVLDVEKKFELPLGEERIRCDCEAWVPQETYRVGNVVLERKAEPGCLVCGGTGLRPRHWIVGILDGVVRYTRGEFSGRLGILEHKFEKRGGRDNDPQKWVARMQKDLYMGCAEQLYGERPVHMILDVITRQSPKGREEASFRRDHLESAPPQIERAFRDMHYTADMISGMRNRFGETDWPRHTEACKTWGVCPYYGLCHIGESPELAGKFSPLVEEHLGI